MLPNLEEMLLDFIFNIFQTVSPVLLKGDNGKKILCRVTSDEDPDFSVESTGTLKVWGKCIVSQCVKRHM